MKFLQNSHSRISLAGMGTTQFWNHSSKESEQCLYDAIDRFGITLIDTAEMYGYGKCEKTTGKILSAFSRDSYYLTDKILPDHVGSQMRKSVEQSLQRLQTDYIDLYLLHWRGNASLADFVTQAEELKKEGKIREWGVSNFDMQDMNDLLVIPNGERCFCNQILYNIATRGPEYDLIPFLREHNIMPMAYSSLGSSRAVSDSVRNNQVFASVCEEYQLSPSSLMLDFIIRNNDIPALFSTSSPAHLKENLRSIDFDYSLVSDLLDKAFPPPTEAVPLEKL